ncbi:MAG: tetratricopeptide repeat protein [Burkholderiaceae bacterium]|nr:tetratricopeptide repeat protein [Burkholderiaceae bacterium]
MLGMSRGVIRGLVDAGFVSPARGPRNELRFSFRDVVLLRAAHGLKAANLPPRRILRALRQLKASLPDELPLTGLRITAVGNTVAVRDAHARWEPESGQLLMDLDVAPAEDALTVLPHRRCSPPPKPPSADELFARAQRLEAEQPGAARAIYRRALALDPGHVDACLNLGALLCDAGRCDEAVRLYAQVLESRPDVAALHFNLAIALEDLHRPEAALASYERCLALDPGFADAHFNAARLHELMGQTQKALRHFSAYRRLQR